MMRRDRTRQPRVDSDVSNEPPSGDENMAHIDTSTEGEEVSSPDGSGAEEFLSTWLELG